MRVRDASVCDCSVEGPKRLVIQPYGGMSDPFSVQHEQILAP